MEKMGGGYEWLILLKDFISRKNYEKIYDGLLKTKKKIRWIGWYFSLMSLLWWEKEKRNAIVHAWRLSVKEIENIIMWKYINYRIGKIVCLVLLKSFMIDYRLLWRSIKQTISLGRVVCTQKKELLCWSEWLLKGALILFFMDYEKTDTIANTEVLWNRHSQILKSLLFTAWYWNAKASSQERVVESGLWKVLFLLDKFSASSFSVLR